jgi:lipopolysaccharide export system protein LptA
MKILFIIFILISNNLIALDTDQTEITTDEGIEIFQEEKYYLLKKNVKIKSKNFTLSADIVKAYFDKDLYDIIKIESLDNVILSSQNGIIAKGQKIYFSIKEEKILIEGIKSSLMKKDLQMFSDVSIEINNYTGEFKLRGDNAKLINNDLNIVGNIINGFFVNNDGINEVNSLYVQDENEINIKTSKINMYAKESKYSKKNNLIELFDDVRIIRSNETIIGDYAKINTITESIKVTSDKTKNKVKILLNNDE